MLLRTTKGLPTSQSDSVYLDCVLLWGRMDGALFRALCLLAAVLQVTRRSNERTLLFQDCKHPSSFTSILLQESQSKPSLTAVNMLLTPVKESINHQLFLLNTGEPIRHPSANNHITAIHIINHLLFKPECD